MTNTTVLGLDPGKLLILPQTVLYIANYESRLNDDKKTNAIGFKHGCKCAVVAPDGTPLHTETIYITFGRPPENQSAAKALKQMVDKFG